MLAEKLIIFNFYRKQEINIFSENQIFLSGAKKNFNLILSFKKKLINTPSGSGGENYILKNQITF